jgi:LPS sulfotransferase NodH
MAKRSPQDGSDGQRWPETTAAVCPDPVFVLGAPRSGKTTLAKALARHSTLWASHEADFLYHLFKGDRIEDTFERGRRSPRRGWLQAEDVDRAEFYRFAGLGMNALLTSRSGGRRWIDHSALSARVAPLLADLFPGARFIHVVRDGRAVVAAMLDMAADTEDKAVASHVQANVSWASDFAEAVVTWRERVRAVDAVSQAHADRLLTVRSEDLLREPQARLARVCSFLGVEPEDGPADRLAELHARPEYHGTPGWHRWTDERHAAFLDAAGDVLRQFGYLGDGEPAGATSSGLPGAAG